MISNNSFSLLVPAQSRFVHKVEFYGRFCVDYLTIFMCLEIKPSFPSRKIHIADFVCGLFSAPASFAVDLCTIVESKFQTRMGEAFLFPYSALCKIMISVNLELSRLVRIRGLLAGCIDFWSLWSVEDTFNDVFVHQNGLLLYVNYGNCIQLLVMELEKKRGREFVIYLERQKCLKRCI